MIPQTQDEIEKLRDERIAQRKASGDIYEATMSQKRAIEIQIKQLEISKLDKMQELLKLRRMNEAFDAEIEKLRDKWWEAGKSR